MPGSARAMYLIIAILRVFTCIGYLVPVKINFNEFIHEFSSLLLFSDAWFILKEFLNGIEFIIHTNTVPIYKRSDKDTTVSTLSWFLRLFLQISFCNRNSNYCASDITSAEYEQQTFLS